MVQGEYSGAVDFDLGHMCNGFNVQKVLHMNPIGFNIAN